MKYFWVYCLFIGIIILVGSCGHKHDNCKDNIEYISLDDNFARSELKLALTDTTLHNCIDKKRIIIKNKGMAVAIAELILSGIYGKENIVNQRPYRISNIDNYWLIAGTLEEGYVGGTFMIIIDSRNGRVVRITHDK